MYRPNNLFASLLVYLYLFSKVVFGMWNDPFLSINLLGFNVYSSDLFIALFGSMILYFIFVQLVSTNDLTIKKYHFIVMMFFLYTMFYLAYGIIKHGKGAVSDSRSFLEILIVIYIISLTYFNKNTVLILCRGIVYSSLLIVVLTVFYYMQLVDLYSANVIMYDYLRGFRITPANVSLLALFSFIILLFPRYISGLPKYFINKKIFFSILFLFIVLINSHRSVWLSAAISIAYYMHVTNTIKNKTIIYLLVLTAFTLLSVAFIINNEIVQYLPKQVNSLKNPLEDATGAWRYNAWVAYLNEIKNSILFGFGFGSEFSWIYLDQEISKQPHNGFIQMTYKMGIIGLILLISAFWVGYSHIKKFTQNFGYKETKYFAVAIILASITYLFFYGIDFTVFLALAIVYGVVGKNVETVSNLTRGLS